MFVEVLTNIGMAVVKALLVKGRQRNRQQALLTAQD